MGRTSKFSFPLPGRKVRSQQPDQIGKLPADTPKLSKAERLLGTTGMDFHNQPQRPQNPHYHLQPRPSFMTLTIAESNASDDISEYDAGTSLSDSMRPLPSRLQALDEDRYKPVRYYEPVEPRHPRSMSYNNVPLVRPFKSSSTLHSHYDLNVSLSQQSPASAARDRPMRNGSAPAIVPEARLRTHQRSQTDHLQDQSPTGKTGHKKRPTRLDLTKLFPKPSVTAGHQPPTTRLARSPTTMSSPSAFRPYGPLPPPHQDGSLSVKSPKKLSKTRQGLWRKPASEKSKSSDSRQLKKHVRRPSKKGRQNWFDGLLEEEDRIEIEDDEKEGHVPILVHEVELQHESKLPYYTYPVPQDVSIRVAEPDPLYGSSLGSRPPHLDTLVKRNSLEGYPRSLQASFVSEARTRSSTHSCYSKRPLESPRSIRSHLGSHGKKRPESLWSKQSPLPSPNNINRKQPGSPWSRHSIGHSPLPSPNVLNTQHPEPPWSHQSPLGSPMVPNVNVQSVSDSESDDGEHDSHFRPVRDSIVISELDDVVTIGQAEAFQVQSRRFYDAVELKRTGKQYVQDTDSVDPTNTSPVTTPTSISFPRPPSHLSSLSARASVIDGTRSRPLSLSAPTSARTSQYSQSALRQPMEPQHKLMVVTEEEEALLEMMRSKRAAMAAHSFAEGNKAALGKKSLTQNVRNMNRESTSATSISASSIRTARSRLSQFDPPLSPPPTGALPTPPTSQRDSVRSEAQPLPTLGSRNMKPTSTSTVTSTSSVRTSLLGMGVSVNKPSLTLEPVDTRLSLYATPIMSRPDTSPTPSNASHVSLLPSPMTPYASISGADIDIKVAGSSHASDSSEVDSENVHQSTSRFLNRPLSLPGKRRSANSDLILSYDELSARISFVSRDKQLPILGDDHSAGMMAGSYFGTNDIGVRPATHAGGCAKHQSTHIHDCGGEEEARCSVSEDVLAAWGDLGGWRTVEQFRLCGTGA
jgi:hypothetical protein